MPFRNESYPCHPMSLTLHACSRKGRGVWANLDLSRVRLFRQNNSEDLDTSYGMKAENWSNGVARMVKLEEISFQLTHEKCGRTSGKGLLKAEWSRSSWDSEVRRSFCLEPLEGKKENFGQSAPEHRRCTVQYKYNMEWRIQYEVCI
jgi:hypothetical protein